MISRRIASIAVVIVLSAFAPTNAFPLNENVGAREAAWASDLAGKYIRTELYFGLARKGGADVTESEFQSFIDEFVTPRFPSGLTILDARGQWRDDDATVTKERSKVLVLIYGRNERRAANTKIEEVRTEYKKRFSQQSVLRLDSRTGISVDF